MSNFCRLRVLNLRFSHSMLTLLPLSLILVIPLHVVYVAALPDTWANKFESLSTALQKRGSINSNPNGSQFIWLPQDEYSGKTFFECVPQVMDSSPPIDLDNACTVAGISSTIQIQRSMHKYNTLLRYLSQADVNTPFQWTCKVSFSRGKLTDIKY